MHHRWATSTSSRPLGTHPDHAPGDSPSTAGGRRRRSPTARLLGLLGLALLAIPACTPEADPLTIDVVGDSITVQSYWNRDDRWREAGVGLDPAYDLEIDAWLGNRFEDVQGREARRASDADAPRPEVLVIALGVNNAADAYGQPGWTTADDAAFRKLLHTPHPDACVVVVLPAAGGAATKAFRDHLATGRRQMRSIAAKRPRTVLVDWGPVVAAHPEYLRSDGIHLADGAAAPGEYADTEPADAYGALLWGGVARCRDLPPPKR